MSSGGISSSDTIALLERAAATADNAALLAASSRFQLHMRDTAFNNDVVTSRLWEVIIGSIANNEMSDACVVNLRELSVGLAAAKPPSIAAVSGICSARLSKAGTNTEALTGALRVIAVLGSVHTIQQQLLRSDLPFLLLRLHQQHSIAASASFATDPSISFRSSLNRSHPVPPLPSSGLRISYSSAAASSSLMSPPSSTQRSAAATLARSGASLNSDASSSSSWVDGGSSRRTQRESGALTSSRDLSSTTGVVSSRRNKDAPLPPLAFGAHRDSSGSAQDVGSASSRRPPVPPLSLPSTEDSGPLTRSSRRHALLSGRTISASSFPSSARASFTSRSVTRRDTMREAVPINLAVSATVELARVASAAGAAVVAAAAAFFSPSASPSASLSKPLHSPIARTFSTESSANSSPATAASFHGRATLPGFFSQRNASSPAASALQLNAAIIHAAAVVLCDSRPFLQRHVPLVLSEMLVCYTESPGSYRDIDEAACLLLQRYGTLLSHHLFQNSLSASLSQRMAADKFVLSLRGQLRLLDLEAGSSGVLRAAALLAALSQHLSVNPATVTVSSYYACIDDVMSIRESLFMQSWSPATDSRIVLLSIVIMRLMSQFFEGMAWQPAREALSKVRRCAEALTWLFAVPQCFTVHFTSFEQVLFCSHDSIQLLRQTCSLALLHEPTCILLAEKHHNIMCAISGGSTSALAISQEVVLSVAASENNVVSVSVLAAAVKSIALDHLAVLMGSCAFIVKFDDELCREFICFVADSPESMLMSALRDGPTANWNSGSICVLKSALNLFLKYATARSLCLSAISATPSQAPQHTPHGHYVTLLYCHMVLSWQLGKLSPCCAQACALYANYLCQLLNLDGGACASVLDGLNAMHFVLHSIGASAISQTKTKSPSKRVIDVPDAAKYTALPSSHAPAAVVVARVSDDEDWSSDDSLGDVDPAKLKAAMLSVKMNLGDDSSQYVSNSAHSRAMDAPAALPVAPAVAGSSIPKFSVLPAKGIQEDTANKYLAEASGTAVPVATVVVAAPSSAAAPAAVKVRGGSASDDDDAWSSDGSDDSFGDVDPVKLKAAMLAVKMNLGDDNRPLPRTADEHFVDGAVAGAFLENDAGQAAQVSHETSGKIALEIKASQFEIENTLKNESHKSDDEEDWSSDDSLGDVDPAKLKAAMLSVKMNLGDDSSQYVSNSAHSRAMDAPAALSLAPAVAGSSIPKFSVLPAKGIQEDTANKYLAEASGTAVPVATVVVAAPSSAAAPAAVKVRGGSASDDDDAWSSDGSDDSFGDVDPVKLKAAMLAVKMNLGDDNSVTPTVNAEDALIKVTVPKPASTLPAASVIAAATGPISTAPGSLSSPHAAPVVAMSPASPATSVHKVADDTHVALLQLALCLMVDTTQGVCIRAPFASQRPSDDGVINVAFLLSRHLSNKRNKMLCLRLARDLSNCGSSHHLRLLKLLSPFPSSLSSGGQMTRVGQGMFGTVSHRLFPLNFPVAVKEIEVPQSAGDRQPLGVVFSEVTSLEVVSAAKACTSLYDFGYDGRSWWLMMEWCPSSLKAWRRGLVGSMDELLPLLLRAYKQVLSLVADMHARLVVHLDLKADNILIRPTTSGNVSGVSLLLGDFGEAMVLGPGAAVMMKQSRGTECIQAPEMLMAGSQHALAKHDRRKPVSASYSADVWSVGCLFYELLFGEFLFSDPEWTQFFVRVTKDILPIASDSAAAAMAPYPQVSAFLSYTLVRNPNMRPSISEVVSKFDAMFGHIMEHPFTASPPTRAPAFDSVAGASHWPVSVPTALEREHFFRSFVPIHLSGNWSGKLHIGCWPPPERTADLNLFVVVSSEPLSAQTSGCHHMCVGLKCIEEFAVSSSEHVAAFRAHLKPCLDALMMCLLQGGSCAICSEEGAGCCDVVVVAVSLLCLGGMSLLQALRLLRQAIVIHTPPPSALDLIHAAFQPA